LTLLSPSLLIVSQEQLGGTCILKQSFWMMGRFCRRFSRVTLFLFCVFLCFSEEDGLLHIHFQKAKIGELWLYATKGLVAFLSSRLVLSCLVLSCLVALFLFFPFLTVFPSTGVASQQSLNPIEAQKEQEKMLLERFQKEVSFFFSSLALFVPSHHFLPLLDVLVFSSTRVLISVMQRSMVMFLIHELS
jgi:hypothetical protein